MGNYIVYDDLKKEGLPASVTPDRANSRITKWELIVEAVTRNVFRILSPGELIFDGNNSRMLHFNLPLVSVVSVKVNGETTALDSDDYTAYIGRQKPQDDRFNPKIVLEPLRRSLYTSTSRAVFVKGYQQRIEATWGFVEPDNSTPQPVKDALIQLVLMDVDGYFDQIQGGSGISGGGAILSAVKRERTDGHEIEYMDVAALPVVWGMLPREVTEILAMYRAPMKIAAPEPVRFYADLTTAVESAYYVGCW